MSTSAYRSCAHRSARVAAKFAAMSSPDDDAVATIAPTVARCGPPGTMSNPGRTSRTGVRGCVLQRHGQALTPIAVDAEVTAGDIALLVRVDDQYPAFGAGEHAADSGDDRTFADAALLIRDQHRAS